MAKAIRDNEPRAISLGYKVNRYKLLAFVISAALTGLAGGTKALVFQLASLTDGLAHQHRSGPDGAGGRHGDDHRTAGRAVLILAMQYYLAPLRRVGHGDPGAVLVTVVMIFRRGLVGEFEAWRVRMASMPGKPALPPRHAPGSFVVHSDAWSGK